jgi:tetratricopeptide (TPR) repeat protein
LRSWGVVALAFYAALAHAQARFLPLPDQVVLPASVHALGSQSVALREAEAAWRRAPEDLDKALDYARAVFVLGLTEGDLRWYGAARAALSPWWTASALPARGHYLRGLVRQGFHDFAGGLKDINAAIALDPAQPEFWSWRFSLHLLASDMASAAADCTEIGRRFGMDEGDACRATLLYRTGRAPQALPLFEALVRKTDYQGALAQGWLRFHQGEALRVSGQPERAAQVWEQHLKAHPRAHGIRLALAELYNEQRQPERARRVADVKAPTDALLVQSLLASRALGDGDTERLAAQVEGRMQVQAERGEALIERPQMTYYIRAGRDLERGLALASQNWREQNEPADAVLLMEAALRLNRPSAGEPVLRWMAQTGYTDPVLEPLARQLQQQLKGS